MKESNFFEFLIKNNIEIYKQFNQNKDDFILIDTKIKETYTQISLIKIYEYLINKDSKGLIKLIYPKDNIDITKIIKDNKNLKEYSFKELIINGYDKKKRYFYEFKNLILMTCLRINGIRFEPIHKRVIEYKGGKYLNTYIPENNYSKIVSNKNAKFPKIDLLLTNIIGKKYIYRFYQLLSWKLQNPLEPLPIHWIIIDDGGTGKTEFLANDILGKIFNCNIIDQEDLNLPYNEYLKNSTILICEEIEDFKNYKKIKLLTGSKKITIKEKYGNLYSITNHNTIIILSNDINPLKIDKNDRRFNVVGGGKRLIPIQGQNWNKTFFKSEEKNKEFFKDYRKNLNTELKEFYSYLLSLELNRNEIQSPLNTNFKKELIELTKPSYDEFIENINNLGFKSIVSQILKWKAENFLQQNILFKDNEYYIPNFNLYWLFLEYSKLKGHKNHLFDTNFYKRIHLNKDFPKVFENSKQIMVDGIRKNYFLIINYNIDN